MKSRTIRFDNMSDHEHAELYDGPQSICSSSYALGRTDLTPKLARASAHLYILF